MTRIYLVEYKVHKYEVMPFTRGRRRWWFEWFTEEMELEVGLDSRKNVMKILYKKFPRNKVTIINIKRKNKSV